MTKWKVSWQCRGYDKDLGISGLTRDEAHRRLQQTSGGGLSSARDRGVHAITVAAVGVLLGLFFSLTKVVDDDGTGRVLLAASYAFLLVALVIWQSRGARTVPRHAHRAALCGVVGSAVLGVVALGVLSSWPAAWVHVVCVVAVAAPSWAAGAIILRRPR